MPTLINKPGFRLVRFKLETNRTAMTSFAAISPENLTYATKVYASSEFEITYSGEFDLQNIISSAVVEECLLQYNIFITDLSTLPLKEEGDSWVIAALAGPRKAADVLLIASASHNPSQPLGLLEGSRVAVKSGVQASQFMLLAPQAEPVIDNRTTQEIYAALQAGKLQAALMPSVCVVGLTTVEDGLMHVPLHVRELVPPAGRGALAFVCNADDVLTRRFLKQWHDTELARHTNVERKFLSLIAAAQRGEIAVHCQTDKRGFYHLTAWHHGVQRSKSISFSTSAGLAEAMAREFN